MTSVVQLLLYRGADVAVTNESGLTTLQVIIASEKSSQVTMDKDNFAHANIKHQRHPNEGMVV